MIVNSLKHLNIEQNKTMMVHYVKVENPYFNFTKFAFYTRHLNKWFFLFCNKFNLFNCYFHFLVPTRKRNKSGLPTECERAWSSPRPVGTFNVGNQAETPDL